ncbi:MAG: tetratricopeptide repeat protein [Ferruginibacter sp.]
MKIITSISLLFLLLITHPVLSQDATSATTAISFSQQGRYKEAAELFDKILTNEPGNTKILVAAAYNNAWAGQFAKAEERFNKALSTDPLNEDAALGLGYTLSWHRKYEKANEQFESILARSADNKDALKGKAYNNLWRGHLREAQAGFNSLFETDGGNIEYTKGLIAVHIEQGKTKEARKLFDVYNSQMTEKDRRVIRNRLHSTPGFVEITPVVGYSKIRHSDYVGLRSAEIAINPRPANRFWLRYDNSLRQDVLSLINDETPAYAFFGGSTIRLKGNSIDYYTTIEAGYRKLDQSTLSQASIRAEEILALPSSFTFRLGGLYAPRNDKTREGLIYGGIGIPVTRKFNVQPTYFISFGNVNEARDSRFMLAGTYKCNSGAEFSSGAIFGKMTTSSKETSINTSQNILNIYSQANIPIGKRHWLQPLVRYEKTGNSELFNAALGYRFRIEK